MGQLSRLSTGEPIGSGLRGNIQNVGVICISNAMDIASCKLTVGDIVLRGDVVGSLAAVLAEWELQVRRAIPGSKRMLCICQLPHQPSWELDTCCTG